MSYADNLDLLALNIADASLVTADSFYLYVHFKSLTNIYISMIR